MRIVGRLITVAIFASFGCGSNPSPVLSLKTKPALSSRPLESAPLCLELFGGQSSGVTKLVWGGQSARGRLAVLRADGRFAVYRPDSGKAPLCVSPDKPSGACLTIALVGIARAVTGDANGLVLWDVSAPIARPLCRREGPTVTALAIDPQNEADPALLVGQSDGVLLRFRLRADDRIDAPSAEMPATEPSRASIRDIVKSPGRGDLLVLREDGVTQRIRSDLSSPFLMTDSSRFAAVDSSIAARIVDGPAVVVTTDASQPRRFVLPRPAGAVAIAEKGTKVIVGCEGSFLILEIPVHRAILAAECLETKGFSGGVVVSSEPEGPRIAIGDGSGRMEIGTMESLMTRCGPMDLDDAPDLAFCPHRRFHRPRPGSRPADCSMALAARIVAARERFDRGQTSWLANVIRGILDNDALTPDATPDVLALAAAVEQEAGGPSPSVNRLLESAAMSFEKIGRIDREADMRFWLGCNQSRPFEPPPGGHETRSAEDAIVPLRRAAELYRESQPPLLRQALLCEAAEAWVLLDLGDLASATRVFRRVSERVKADGVLGQVVELERLAGALHAAKGEWATAASCYARLLHRLPSGERPRLRREAALSLAGSLAALGKNRQAAEVLEPDSPDDPEWRLRRFGYRHLAGLPVSMPPPKEKHETSDAHLRGRIASWESSGRTGDADLTLAAEIHRRNGFDDLAAEAELERAEILERQNQADDALSLFAGVARHLRATGDDPIRRASRPIVAATNRTYRGLARAAIALKKPGVALAAVEAAELSRVRAFEGPLSIPATEWPSLRRLAEARRAFEQTGKAEALVEVQRLRTSLFGYFRLFAPMDPSIGIDVANLGLKESECVLVYAATGQESLVAFLVRAEHEPEVVPLPISRTELAEAVQSWRRSLGDGGRPLAAVDARELPLGLVSEPDEPRKSLVKAIAAPPWEAILHDALIAPIESRLEGVSQLIVIPNDELGAMPIEVIGRGNRVGQRWSVSYAPALAFIRAWRDERRSNETPGKRAIVAGPGDPSLLTGIAAVLSEGGLQPEVLQGSEVASRMRDGWPSDLSVVFLAAEAMLEPKPGAFSQVELRFASGAETLPATSLARIPLNGRLLTPRVTDPNGLSGAGLRSLAFAGAATGSQAVLVTLWSPPPGSSARFLTEFHREVATGKPAGKALEVARMAVARDPKYGDPVHWAGYAMYGVP